MAMTSLTAIRLIFSIAVHYNTCILHADVPSAFCQSELDTGRFCGFPSPKGVSLVDDEGSCSIIDYSALVKGPVRPPPEPTVVQQTLK